MNGTFELRTALDRVGLRYRHLQFLGGLSVGWLALAGLGALLPRTEASADGLAIAAGIVAFGWWLVCRRAGRDPRWVARRIEARHPDLAAGLLAAVEQQPEADGRFGFLQHSVIESALAHKRAHDWADVVPAARLNVARAAMALSATVLVIVGVTLALSRPSTTELGATASAQAGSSVVVEVDPGHAQIERGSPLLVIAKFPGAIPAEATLVAEAATAPKLERTMTRSLDDPTFAGHIPAVENEMTYRVEFPGGESESFRVTVYEHPELKRVDAALDFPAYTGLPQKKVADVRHVTAVEGTTATVDFRLNKAVVEAKLVDEEKRELPLVLADAEKHVYRATLKLVDSRRYSVKLKDADGRTNKLPADFAVNVTRNLPPTVSVPRPGRDSRVSPLEELAVKADLKDDYGLVRFGISVVAPDQTTKEIVLGETTAKRAQPDHMLDFEGMKAQPDQVVSYHFWAEDIGPDGQRRRASGDLYFAEVRHFEEIFRQGEQQSREQQEREQQQREQGQGGNAEQAEQLSEMQKQIVAAIWKLVRREIGPKPTEKFAEDVDVVRQSQKAIIEKAGELAEKLQAAESIQHLERATKFMAETETKLSAATTKSLAPALAAAQAAYQALLKLRAREFEVTRNNSRQRQNSRSAQSSSRSPSQRQLSQLDLANEENRYETQNSAKAQQERQTQRDREQRENQELADRLKELSRRQTDLTDRVKELQAALEQAADAKKKEELQQQLKRLRDQQQQALRDADELQQKLEGQENREKSADARQQLEQGRENIRQAAEALEKGRLSQAVNEGTRAARQLDELRDQLKRDSANRFGDEMRELRQQARQLDEQQKDLTKQLDDRKPAAKPALRDEGQQKIEKGLEEQKKSFDRIAERIQKTVREAEQPEPLLAQGLYDTARKAAEQKVGESLDHARRLAAAGATPDAADAARKAAAGTDELRKGVEKAAEGVLGGQTEALKRAKRELDELSEQFDRELAQATGRQPRERKGENPQPKEAPKPGQQGQPNRPMPGAQQAQGGERGQPNQPIPGTQQAQGGSSMRRNLNDPPMPGQRQTGGERTGQGSAGGGGPVREEGFREWYDRLRSAEELIEDPALRAEAAAIRDRVRSAREEFKRHAKEPDWKKLERMVSKPLNELRQRVAEEVRRREKPDSLVPIDRDPVPPEFAEGVRKYYERLGEKR